MNVPSEVLTSRQNPLVSLTVSLSDRKFREREKLFRLDGKKLFLEALRKNVPLSVVLFRASAAEELTAAAEGLSLPEDCRAVLLPDELFARISEEKSPEGVICLSKYLDKLHKIIKINTGEALPAELLPGRTLLLESVRDPGNLGTVVRCARAFGVANLVLTADCADLYHPRAVRAAMGTLFSQRVLTIGDGVAAAKVLKERGRVFAAALDGGAVRLADAGLTENDTVIVGNEGHGISAPLLAAASHKLYIPMSEGVESLNAAIAASVILWEWVR